MGYTAPVQAKPAGTSRLTPQFAANGTGHFLIDEAEFVDQRNIGEAGGGADRRAPASHPQDCVSSAVNPP